MKNSKLRRVLMLLACAVLLVSLSVGATLAYLTSTTGVVENTFTVGKVVLDDPNTPNLNDGLDEAKTNEYGVPVKDSGKKDDKGNIIWEECTVAEAPRVQENTYKLIPGHTYSKDPIVYVQAGSEPCLVFVIVDDPLGEEGVIQWWDNANISSQMAGTEAAPGPWWIIHGEGSKTLYAYRTVVDARNAKIPLDTFKTIKVCDNLEYDDLKDYAGEQITIQAFAIQADGMVAKAVDGYTPGYWDFYNVWDNNFASHFDLPDTGNN